MSQQPRLSRSFCDLPIGNEADEPRPSHFSRRLLGSQGFGWDELLRSSRVQITSEAGTGKTYECRAEQEARWAAGEAAFYVELSQLGSNQSLTDLMSGEEVDRYNAWLKSQSDVATVFLDSYDELKLTRGSFETVLKRLGKIFSGQLERVKIVITTRPILFDNEIFKKYLPVPKMGQKLDGGSFADAMMDNRSRTTKNENEVEEAAAWRSVELQPLSSSQVETFAKSQGVEDTSALLNDIRTRNAEEFAKRPQDLIELCADWRDHQRIRTHCEQVKTNINIKLKPRDNRPEHEPLDHNKAIEGVSKLALAMLLSRKLNLRYHASSDRGATGAALDPSKILTDWSAPERQALLERGIFGFAGYGRVRFHNQSVIEFLAARQLGALREDGMSLKSVKRILFAQTPQGLKVAKPSMRPVAAWLSLSNDSIFAELRARAPEVLIESGDPESLTDSQRSQVLNAYFERNCNGGWRGHSFSRIQLKRFGTNELSNCVLDLLDKRAENPEMRRFLFELVSESRISGCNDKAFETAIDSNCDEDERMYAVEALMNLNDDRIDQITESMTSTPASWSDRLLTNCLIRLFPSAIDLEHLRLLLRERPASQRDRESIGDFFAASLEDDCSLSAEYLEELRSMLFDLVAEGLEPQEKWYSLVSNRNHLLGPLAAVCRCLLDQGYNSDDLLESSVATIRLAENSGTRTDQISNLQSSLLKLPTAVNMRAVWIADSFNLQYSTKEKPKFRLGNIVHHCSLRVDENDSKWVLAQLAEQDRTVDQRELLLNAAILCTWDKSGDYSDYLKSLKSKVADNDVLASLIDKRLIVPDPDPELEKIEQDHESYRQRKIREAKEAHTSWFEFWTEISSEPDTAFDAGHLDNTTWNLWEAMKRSGDKGRASGWNRRFIEHHFDKTTADRLRLSLKAVWRKEKPTFRSERPPEKKDNFFGKWELGLAGISAESEDTGWAGQLSQDEVELALRYVSIGCGGLPNWLGDLVRSHPEIVANILGDEFIQDLDELADSNSHFLLLSKLQFASADLCKLFVPRLHKWFDQNNNRIRESEVSAKIVRRLSGVAEILLTHGSEELSSELGKIATERLNERVAPGFLAFWFSILLRVSPASGTERLENTLTETDDPELAEEFFAKLFGNHRDSTGWQIGFSKFPPSILLRLTRLAYSQIRLENDNVHEGVYSPNCRDNAQSGRGSLLSALLATEGPEAWTAKIEMANDPLFCNFCDRMLLLALEKAAEELDTERLSETEILKLYSRYEAPLKTRDSMFELLVDRLDDLDDLLLMDDSPRETWALISKEKVMRREISRQLRMAANGAYTVDQEGVTADEKETDVRLRSNTAQQQAVIELKLGENGWSGRKLRDTMKEQLVEKYMADSSCRSGCLLVTVARDRKWQHPDSGVMLAAAELEAMLREEARKIEAEMGHTLRLTAKVLDLRPRLATEQNADK